MTTRNAIHELIKNPLGSGELGVFASPLSPVDYFFTCPTGNPHLQAQIDNVNIIIVDKAIAPSSFGGIAGGIVNGIEIHYVDKNGNSLKSFTGENHIRQNFDWGLLVGRGANFSGMGSGVLIIHWSITGKPLVLGPGQSLRFRVQDDLSPLESFLAMVHGSFRFGGSA